MSKCSVENFDFRGHLPTFAAENTKCSNHGCQSGKKCRFLSKFSTFELYYCLVDSGKKIKLVPLITKDIKKK